MSLCLSNLLLTGCATPFLHNGINETDEVETDKDDKHHTNTTLLVQGLEELGLTDRNSVGFLIWDRGTERTRAHGLGSRLGFSYYDFQLSLLYSTPGSRPRTSRSG